MKKPKFLLVLACSIVSFGSFAQETLHLTLPEAKGYALRHNRSLKTSELSVQKAESAKWQSIASMLPHVDAKLGYTNFLGHETELSLEPGAAIKIPMNPYGDLTLQASIGFTGMQIVGIQLSNLAIDMSKLNLNLSDLNIKANVTTAYLSVLVAEESKKLLESSRENVEKLFESTKKMYEVGVAEQTAVDQLEVQLGLIANEVKTTERNIELAYNSLRLILGVSSSTELNLTDNVEAFLTDGEAYKAAETEFNVEENYTVKLLNQNVKISEKQVALKKWEHTPTLAVFYQYSGQTYFGESEGFSMTPPNTLGATLSIPIFSSGERFSKLKQSKIDLQIAELERDDALQGLKVQERQLRFLLNSAIETYELQKKNVEVSDRIFQKTVQKYELGTASSTDLTTINNNLISAQGSYIGALMELLSAQVNLQKLLQTM